MSPSPNAPVSPMRPLAIDIGIPTVEVFIIDGHNTVVARGVGSLNVELPPGIYKIRARVGSTVADKMFELPPGVGAYTPPQEDMPEMPMVSPVPLTAAGIETRPSAPNASEWSKSVHVHHGTGSRIFLFIDSNLQPVAADSITLRTFDGTQIASLAQGGFKPGCYGCNVELNPGGYILHAEREELPAIEQAIYAAPNWQTQVYIPIVPRSGMSVADLSGVSILMSSYAEGFKSDSPEFLWAEAARKTLASANSKVAPDDQMLNDLMYGKFQNPMLGIYAAHLIVRQNDSSRNSLLLTIANNLQSLVGDLPDVTSLFLYLNDPREQTLTFPTPPMLASSWRLIVSKSAEYTNLVPTQSLTARVSGCLWGSGAWVVWKPAEMVNVVSSPVAADWNQLWQSATNPSISYGDLNPAERAVMSYVSNRANRTELIKTPLVTVSPGAPAPVPINPADIASATGIPYSVVNDAAASLNKKLLGGMQPKTEVR